MSHETLPPKSEMERAYLAKDASYDGIFFLAVVTTGIFCRPSCPAKTPKPENVRYFATVGEAMAAGFRACKRCRPLEAAGTPPEWVDRLVAELERDPERRLRDGDLERMGIEPARARRWFRAHTGMTFHGYQRARRLGDAFAQLRRGAPLDDVALGSGFESHSGFRDAFSRLFGAPPGRARAAAGEVRIAWFESPLGPLVAGAVDDGVCLLEFSDRRMLEAQMTTVRRNLARPLVPGHNAHLERLEDELRGYFAGAVREFAGPLVVPGTEFQRQVWQELGRIPYGETVSYEELAGRVGRPGAQRAVGHANGLNRIAIVIPCHRVVNKDGRLGGYGGGLWRKQFLLDLERGRRAPELEREGRTLPALQPHLPLAVN